MTESSNQKVNNAFFRFGGVVGRAQFFVNMLVIGSIFGASFSLLFIDSNNVPTVVMEEMRYGSLSLGIYGIFLGVILGVLCVLSSGLTCLWAGLLGAAVFILGSLSNLATPSILHKTQMTGTFSAGLIMIHLFILAYANVAKRVRHILGNDKHAHAWCMVLLFLSFIPFVGTILWLALLCTPATIKKS